jgi:hypothetical protein
MLAALQGNELSMSGLFKGQVTSVQGKSLVLANALMVLTKISDLPRRTRIPFLYQAGDEMAERRGSRVRFDARVRRRHHIKGGSQRTFGRRSVSYEHGERSWLLTAADQLS